jgi:hypothetical protein
MLRFMRSEVTMAPYIKAGFLSELSVQLWLDGFTIWVWYKNVVSTRDISVILSTNIPLFVK